MKKIIQILLLIFLSLFAFAQEKKDSLPQKKRDTVQQKNDKFSLGFFYSHDLWYNQTDYYQANIGYNMGLSAIVPISQKFNIKISLTIGRLGYSSSILDSLYYKDGTTASYIAPNFNFFKSVNCYYKRNYSVLQLPISFQYAIMNKNKISLYLGMGCVIQDFYNKELLIYDNKNTLIYRYFGNYNYRDFSVAINVGISYKITNSIIANIEPIIRADLASSFYALTTAIGINYKF